MLSNPMKVQVGVPQGSILGPLLFIVFINDLSNCLTNVSTNMYADDTTIYFSNKILNNVTSVLNKSLDTLSNWLIANKLILNESKTKCMLVGTTHKTHKNRLPLVINNINIEQVTGIKCLGVNIDQNLTWGNHVTTVCKKESSKIGVLRNLKPILPFNQLKQLYSSIVLPHFNYCSSVWGLRYKTHTDKLEKLQRRAARVVLNVNYETPSHTLCPLLHWPTITQRFKLNTALLVFKTTHNFSPQYLSNIFTFTKNVSLRHTRQTDKHTLYIQHYKTNYMCHSFEVKGSRIFNILSNQARGASTINSFKNYAKKDLFV